MRNPCLLSALLTALILPSPVGHAEEPLAVGHASGQTSSYANYVSHRVTLGQAGSSGLTNQLFENHVITVGDVGTTFTATADTDPDFPGFVSVLTNGNNDGTLVENRIFDLGLWVSGGLESSFWSGLPPAGNGIDLQGFAVGRITMTIDTFTVEQHVEGLQTRTDATWEQTFRVYSAIPEPTTLTLLGLGSLALGMARRRE